MTLGNAIKLIRTARAIKQVDLAKQMDVSANYLSLIEKDKREPSISFLNKLAAALEVPLSVFFMTQEINANRERSQVQELGDLLVQLQAMISSGSGKRRGRKKAA